MKKILLLVGIVFSTFLSAQLSDVQKEISKTAIVNKDTIDGWKKGGTLSLLFNQSTFSNWVAGGINNVAGNAFINYDINYKKGSWTWDNKIILAYGASKNKGEDYRKTDDRIELNSLVGKKAFGNWSYSFFANFRTQFTDGFDYSSTPPTGKTYEDYPTSGFLKPAYLTFGPGLLWKKSNNLKVNLAPVTSKITYLGGKIYSGNQSSDEITVFGVEPGKNFRYELGFYAAGYYKIPLMKNVSMENILTLYSNYLDEPKNIDFDYTMNLAMQINKYLSTNFTVQTVYDDNAFEGLQVREVFGLGFNVNF